MKKKLRWTSERVEVRERGKERDEGKESRFEKKRRNHGGEFVMGWGNSEKVTGLVQVSLVSSHLLSLIPFFHLSPSCFFHTKMLRRKMNDFRCLVRRLANWEQEVLLNLTQWMRKTWWSRERGVISLRFKIMTRMRKDLLLLFLSSCFVFSLIPLDIISLLFWLSLPFKKLFPYSPNFFLSSCIRWTHNGFQLVPPSPLFSFLSPSVSFHLDFKLSPSVFTLIIQPATCVLLFPISFIILTIIIPFRFHSLLVLSSSLLRLNFSSFSLLFFVSQALAQRKLGYRKKATLLTSFLLFLISLLSERVRESFSILLCPPFH